jgi:hypothetical protein
MTKQHFDPYARKYSSLSVKDLLDGREACHLQLSHSSNVFATAIGMYLIRSDDPDAKEYTPPSQAVAKRGRLGPRTLENSVVKPWSWPCVLVFVREWMDPHEIHGYDQQPIPPFLYLSDGRVIPVCTVLANLYEGSPARSTGPLTFTSNIIGGGYPVLSEVQGQEHVGSIACLVSDGDRYFALTNQHVAGEAGREIYTMVKGERRRVGVAATNSLRKADFKRLYPAFSGSDLQSNLDIGLINVDDVSQWTSQVFGLGVLGPLIDFDSITATLDWIGIPVLAHGGASGRMEGEIKALFYRYRTVNGTDFVSDFLIGGRGSAPLLTGPGDSGTLWCVDPLAGCETLPLAQQTQRQGTKAKKLPERYRPIAVEWGGQKLSGPEGDQYTQYALASSLAAACAQLDIEVITDINAEHTQYWGAVGHYKIAQLAINLAQSPELKRFLTDNLAQLTYDAAQIQANNIARDASQFVPLADVPDLVWKTNINRGGKAARAQENWNHYTDIDQPGKDGRTLSELCGDPPRISLSDWISFYQTAPVPSASKSRSNNMGALPFRVWQIFNAMVDYRKKNDAERFLCAAGILSHYIGDACQPLHSSMHSDGLNGASTGVHSIYEEKMIDVFAEELRQGLDAFLWGAPETGWVPVHSGYQAAQASLQLMRRAQEILPPQTICDTFNPLGGGRSQALIKGMWQALGKQTVHCIAEGARVLALLWDAAYGAAKPGAFTGVVSRSKLQRIYEDQDFLPSLHLKNLEPSDYTIPVGNGAGDSHAPVHPPGKKAKPDHRVTVAVR